MHCYRKLSGSVLLVAALAVTSAPVAAATISDSFTGTAPSAYWSVLQDAPAQLWLEQDDRINVLSSAAGSASNDAIYLSDGASGFRLRTDSDFVITIDYDVTTFTGSGLIALNLGVGNDLDGQDSAAIGFVCSSNPLLNQLLVPAYRINDVETSVPMVPVASSGTLLVQYDSAVDILTLGLDDGISFHRVKLPGLVRTTWNATSLWVAFGARGQGLVFSSGDATLDNLTINGHFTAVPEPATLAMILAGGALAMLRRRRSRRS